MAPAGGALKQAVGPGPQHSIGGWPESGRPARRGEVRGEHRAAVGEDAIDVPPHPQRGDEAAEEAPTHPVAHLVRDAGAAVRQVSKRWVWCQSA